MGEKPFILVVEDNPADIRLIHEALKETSIQATVKFLNDGQSTTRFLDKAKRETQAGLPHMILLDLNLPNKGGVDVLKFIKFDDILKRIPVIVLSSSQNADDIAQAYDLHANCFITKPVEFEPFINIVKALEYFWIHLVKLPSTAVTHSSQSTP